MSEDQAFFAKLLLRDNVFVSSKCWDRYRQHEASCYAVAKRPGQRNAARRRYLRWLKSYLSQQDPATVPLRETVAQELRRLSLRAKVLGRCRQGVDWTLKQTRRLARAVLPAPLLSWSGEISEIATP
jgi:hypothetical protein